MTYVLHGAEEGNRIALGPNEMDIRLAGRDTKGTFSLCQYTIPPGGPEPPPHIHQRTQETFHVLEGELQLRVGEERFTAGPGSTLLVPEGDLHTFSNAGAGPARFLIIYVPGGFEEYFEEMGEFLKTMPPGPPDMSKVQAKAMELGKVYDQVVPSQEQGS